MTGFSQPRNADEQTRKQSPGGTGRRREWEGRGGREKGVIHTVTLATRLLAVISGRSVRPGDSSETVHLPAAWWRPAPGSPPPGAPPAPQSPVRTSGP